MEARIIGTKTILYFGSSSTNKFRTCLNYISRVVKASSLTSTTLSLSKPLKTDTPGTSSCDITVMVLNGEKTFLICGKSLNWFVFTIVSTISVQEMNILDIPANGIE